MWKTYPSRSGPLSASFHGQQIHSGFDPRREADRFVATELAEIPQTVIVIGPGLGYIIEAVHERRNDARVVAFFLSTESYSSAVNRGDAAWHPQSGYDAASFLSSSVDELESASLVVTEWPPATSCFSEEARRIRAAVSDVVHRHTSSLMTEGANGRRWLSNLFRNFLTLNSCVEVANGPAGSGAAGAGSGVSACIIAASGPSLEESLARIRPLRERFALWVVGSALDATTNAGMQPDLVLSTDPAVYASEYLRDALAEPARGYPVAAPLTASRGITDSGGIWPLSQGDMVEDLLFGRLRSRPVTVPAHGTVTGTAFHLATSLSRWPVIYLGMDLAYRGGQTHARPHVADTYAFCNAGRLQPRSTAGFAASRHWRHLDDGWFTDRALSVYAAWFEQSVEARRTNVYRMHPSPAAPAVPEITVEQMEELPVSFNRPRFVAGSWPGRDERNAIVRKAADQLEGALAAICSQASRRAPDRLAHFLLRRLALEKLIRWKRSGDPAMLKDAAATALERLRSIHGSAP